MTRKKSLTRELIPQKTMETNKEAYKSYDLYKKTAEIMERMDIAMGKKHTYFSSQNSTVNYKIEIHGLSSTQKI